MEYRTLNRSESDSQMKRWILNGTLPALTDDELKFRDYLLAEYKKIKEQTKDNYKIDLNFGIALYKYLNQMGDFTMRVAADDGFWRYLSLMLIPDIVSDRWGKENEAHFWARSTRIYPRQIWWYVHLSWQGDADLETTRQILLNPCFTTDEIMNLVERCGRKGAYIEVYRKIVLKYSKVSAEERKKHQDGRKGLFRKIMIFNNARYVVVDPYLYGIDAYVDGLFKDLKVRI